MLAKLSLIMAGLSPLVCAAYDDMGADEDAIVLAGYDDMGAVRRRPAQRGGGAPPARYQPTSRPSTRREALDAYQPDSQGQAVDQVMPFPNGIISATATTLLLQSSPQRAFQVRRLVIDRQNTGASATSLLQVTQLTVGADQQFVNSGSIPATMFSPTAVGIQLKPSAARPGITVSLGLSVVTPPTTTDTILVSAAAVGPALG